jgi:hypothetical protein
MIKMFKLQESCFRSSRMRPAIVPALLVFLLQACAIGQAYAQDPPPAFNLQINRDYTHFDYYTGKKSTTVNPYIIANQENAPYLYLENLSAEPLLDFHIALPDMDGVVSPLHFQAPIPGASSLIHVQDKNPSSVEVSASLGNDGNQLDLSFGSGLAENEFVVFQIKFGWDGNENIGKPSYQLTLFNYCSNGESMGDPALITANFEGGESSGGLWSNYEFNPYDEGHYAPTATTLEVNPPASTPFFPEPIVPEPSALILALTACGISSAIRRRRRYV